MDCREQLARPALTVCAFARIVDNEYSSVLLAFCNSIALLCVHFAPFAFSFAILSVWFFVLFN
jgi:hypothetical protein